MNYKHGFIAPLILALIALLILGGGAYVYVQNKQTTQPTTVVAPPTQTTQTTPTRKNEFTVSPTAGTGPLAVTFSFILLNTNVSANTYSVVFGDSTPATGAMQETRCAGECRKFTVAHTYINPGTYTAKLIENIGGAKSGGKYLGTATITITGYKPD